MRDDNPRLSLILDYVNGFASVITNEETNVLNQLDGAFGLSEITTIHNAKDGIRELELHGFIERLTTPCDNTEYIKLTNLGHALQLALDESKTE